VAYLKILFITNSLGKGGGERVVANLANEMRKEHEVCIISVYADVFYELDNQISFYSLNQEKNKIKKFLSYFCLKKKLNILVRKLEKEKEYDIITVHLPFAHLVVRNTYFSHRSFFVIHTVYSQKASLNVGRVILKYLYNNRDLIAVSEGVKSEITRTFKVKYRRILMISNPIDIALITRNGKEFIDVDYKYILGVGRLTEIKRFDLLIKAFSNSHAKEKYKLVLIGEGSEEIKLMELSSKLGIEDKIEFKGWQSNPYKWMRGADLMVITSQYESFSMTMLEALACGTIVLSVDCDYGPREILTNELKPFLISDDSVESIANSIDQSLCNSLNDVTKHVLRYDIGQIATKYLEVTHGK